MAYALGPNYNKPWEAFDEADLRTSTERAVAAASRARQLTAGVTPAERALIGTAELEAAIPDRLLRVQSPPMADWLEGFLAMRVHVLVRFGRWPDVLELPLPADPALYSVATAMLHYGKGVACSALGRIAQAERERELFGRARASCGSRRRWRTRRWRRRASAAWIRYGTPVTRSHAGPGRCGRRGPPTSG